MSHRSGRRSLKELLDSLKGGLAKTLISVPGGRDHRRYVFGSARPVDIASDNSYCLRHSLWLTSVSPIDARYAFEWLGF